MIWKKDSESWRELTMKKGKILIAVPTFESIKPECFKGIYGIKPPEEYNLFFDYVKGYDCAKARNEIAKEAIEYDMDYILMVDSDIAVPRLTVEKLLECDSDVALGWYYRKRTKTDETIIFDFGKDFNQHNAIKGQTMINNIHESFSCKGGGLGIALIKIEVFEKIDFPYFKFVNYSNDTVLSEDLYFCNKVRDNGMEIKCNPFVKGDHIFDMLM